MNNDLVQLSANAEMRIKEIRSKVENQNKHLRVTVSGGGCSGFQYSFALDDKIENDDFKVEKGSDILVAIDNVSLDFLKNCVIDYVSDLGGAYFKINNPNAKVTCGCGSSFAV
jgi:iron-sulfur cluster insertion protein